MRRSKQIICKSLFHLSLLSTAVLGSTAVNAAAIEEVIVTAQHRAQSIQDVPIAISALGSEELEAAGISDATAIALNVPGMSYAEFSPGQSVIGMRGISSADDGAGLDNSIGLFLDGVYIGRGAAINFDMFDIERIEVLKGPQGTLFGRNSIGGAISVVTKKPSQEMEGKAALTLGNEGIRRYQAYVTGPLSDTLSGKVVINHREHDGYTRNVFLEKDVQDEDQTSARGQLMWDFGSSQWTLSADTMDDEREDAGRVPIVNGNFDYLSLIKTLGVTGPWQTAAPIEGFTNRESSGISLSGEVGFDTGVFTTITGFRNVETDWEMPSIGAPAGGGFDRAAGVYGVDVNDDIEEEIDTMSQEFRWASNNDGNFQYIGGLYFFKEDTDRVEQFKLDRNTTAGPQVFVGNEYTRTENETTSYAIFGQGNWEVNDEWTWTIGGRFTKDERDYTASAVNCGMAEADKAAAGFPNFAPCGAAGSSLGIIAETFRRSAKEDWDNFSPMTSIQYRPADGNVMYYGTISTGYKAGGFAGSQGIAAASTRPVDEEEATNFELGFKGDFIDDTFRLNMSVFQIDYEDLQVVRFGPVAGSAFGTFQTTNVGEADIKGLEMDFIWNISDNFTLSGNYGYLDTETKDLVLNGFTGANDYSNLELTRSPKNSYNLTANYNLPASNGTYDFRLQFSHQDEMHHDYPTYKDTVSEEMDLIDARISWVSTDEKYELALWGKNLSDEDYISHSYRIGPGTIGIYGDPRTVGLTAAVNF